MRSRPEKSLSISASKPPSAVISREAAPSPLPISQKQISPRFTKRVYHRKRFADEGKVESVPPVGQRDLRLKVKLEGKIAAFPPHCVTYGRIRRSMISYPRRFVGRLTAIGMFTKIGKLPVLSPSDDPHVISHGFHEKHIRADDFQSAVNSGAARIPLRKAAGTVGNVERLSRCVMSE